MLSVIWPNVKSQYGERRYARGQALHGLPLRPRVYSNPLQESVPSLREPNARLGSFDTHCDLSQPETDGSAENYSNSMCFPVIGQREVAGQDNAVDLH